jgi:hypothetical protein
MSSWFQKHYCSEKAYSLYLLYENGDDSVLNELLTALCPLVRKCSRLECSSVSSGDQGMIEADALNEVYRVLENKSVPITCDRVFTRYLATVINRTFRDSLNELHQQTFEFWKVAQYPDGGRIVSQLDVDAELYRTQIVREILKTIYSRIRFRDSEREACMFIVDCVLGVKDVDPKVVRRKHLLKSRRCKYLINYVNILVRSTLWEFGEREHKDGPLSLDWTTGRGILRTTSELGQVHVSA